MTTMLNRPETAQARPPQRLVLQRAQGHGEVRFENRAGTRLAHLHQAGCCKIRLPKVHGSAPEAVFLNTAGGMTGGDRVFYEAAVGDTASAVFTTQACERIYRSTGEDAQIENTLRVGDDGHADWLPQETILFEGGRLRRTFNVELGSGSSFIAVESVILGREAMGEAVVSGSFRDRWRVRRNGRLVFADDTRLPPDMSLGLTGSGSLSGARAFATLVRIGDGLDGTVDALRSIGTNIHFGVSEVASGVLVARMIAPDGKSLRAAMTDALTYLRQDQPMPRVWAT